MRRRCLCRCHEGSITDRRRADGVDVRDPVEAVVACAVCVNHHCPALVEEYPGESVPLITETRRGLAISQDGQTYTYEDGEFRPWAGEDGG